MRVRLFLGTIATGVLACAQPADVPINQDFRLRLGETARITATDLTITFREVSEDSRCARDVVCVWAGNGRVLLQIRRAGTDTTLALNTTLAPRAAPVDGFRLELRGLAPQPVAGQPIPPTDYTAELRVLAP